MMLGSKTMVVIAVGVCLLAMATGASATGERDLLSDYRGAACHNDIFCKVCKWGHCQSCFRGYKLWYGKCERDCRRCTPNCSSCDCGKCWGCNNGYRLWDGYCVRSLGHSHTCNGFHCSSYSSTSGNGGRAWSSASTSSHGTTHTSTTVSGNSVSSSAYASSHG